MTIQHKSYVGIASLLTIGLAFGAAPLATANTAGSRSSHPSTTSETSSSALDTKKLEASIEKGFQTLFTEIISQNSTGVWKVNEGFESKYPDVSKEDVQGIVNSLNKYEKSGQSLTQQRSIEEYGRCVLEGLIPFGGLISINWGNVYLWIKQNSWGKLAKYLAKHAAKVGIKDLAKFTPQGLAVSLAASMVTCAIFDR